MLVPTASPARIPVAERDNTAERAQRKLQQWPWLLRGFMAILGVCLALYAFLGKGFAYFGWPPLYVGEILLLVGLLTLPFSQRMFSLCLSPIGVIFMAFVAWQAIRTVPFVDTYGMDALRDGVIWGYASFAWIVAALVLRLPGFLHHAVVIRYIRFAKTFLILGPVLWLSTLYFKDWLPYWPGTTVTVPLIKGDEFCVHLAGILAITLQGLGSARLTWVPLILVDAILAMNVRSGLLAFVAAAGFAVILRPRPTRVVLLIAATALIVTAMATFDVRLPIPGRVREFSVQQLTESVQSVIGRSSRSDLEGTKRWRLEWWSKIVDYTVTGPYFWMGKGYGINLADSDGFQVGTNRNPSEVLTTPTWPSWRDLVCPGSSCGCFYKRSGRAVSSAPTSALALWTMPIG